MKAKKTTNTFKISAVVMGVIVILAIFLARHKIADYWEYLNRPTLPPAETYQPSNSGKVNDVAQAPPSPVEGGSATSEHYVLDSSPQTTTKAKDVLAAPFDLPTEINLSVPWMSQAPLSNWDMPYQEACEEASMIMVSKFYANFKDARIPPEQADAEILKLVDFENNTLGFYKDTNAQETSDILQLYFGFKDVRVLPLKTVDDIKNIVGRGYPVIVPFYGKALNNPNFRNGGPLYHMLVIKGYLSDGRLITNDPGTRKGLDYIYDAQTIMDAAHDWNCGDVENGKKVMLVVLPN
jgi:hypothetical protein